ncbi:MAG: restriction endonuclease subunit S [Candidatus Electrothrix sp. ATG2]|nr:restriction endonuclease subunit S [Candidatus Electrothrix sp. ATG2]
MGGEWQLMTLKEAGVTLIDCIHKTPPDAGDGYPYIAIPQMKEGRIDFHADPRLISESDFIEWTKKAYPQENDVVLSRRCNPGETAHVPPRVRFALGQNLVLLRSDSKKVYPPFLRWLTKGFQWWNQTSKFLNVGAVFDSLRCADIPNFELTIPPLPEQKAIAHILGSLDDKIELNRQMNATLEAMAQALFKSWFVDFDPVIDKALAAGNPIPEPLHKRAEARKALGDQRKPLPADIAQHFPDRFVFNEEMGWVPEGWEESTIGDEVEIMGGGTPSTKDATFWEGGVHPFCTPKDMSTLGSIVLTDTIRHLTDAGVKKISSGQLPKGVVLMSSRAPIGYLAISDVPVSVNQGIIGMLPNQKYGSTYLLFWAHFNMGAIKDRANGSTFLEISKKNFRPIPFLVPAQELTEFFNEQVKGIYNKMLLLSEQVRELSTLRDTLLPKLLSGQLRIPDAEKLIKETA